MKERVKKVLEKDVEKEVCDYAKSRGFWHRKFQSPNNRAAPDRIFKHPRCPVFFIEFKRPGKARTFPSGEHERAQAREHERILESGSAVYVIDTVAAGKQLIDGHL